MQWNIGDIVKDEDNNTGIVGIHWNDGDFCTIENDAAHPNPILTDQMKRDAFSGKWPEQDAAKIAYSAYSAIINEHNPARMGRIIGQNATGMVYGYG